MLDGIRLQNEDWAATLSDHFTECVPSPHDEASLFGWATDPLESFQADDDIAEGRIRSFDSMEALIGDLRDDTDPDISAAEV